MNEVSLIYLQISYFYFLKIKQYIFYLIKNISSRNHKYLIMHKLNSQDFFFNFKSKIILFILSLLKKTSLYTLQTWIVMQEKSPCYSTIVRDDTVASIWKTQENVVSTANKTILYTFPIRVLRVETSLSCHHQPETPCIDGRRGNEVRSLFIARPVYSAFNLHRDKYRLAETTDLCPLPDRKGEEVPEPVGVESGGGGGRDESKEIQRRGETSISLGNERKRI